MTPFKAARLATGLTQAQAGAVIGATRRAVQEWEGARRNCPSAKLALFIMLTAGMQPQPSEHRSTGAPLQPPPHVPQDGPPSE